MARSLSPVTGYFSEADRVLMKVLCDTMKCTPPELLRWALHWYAAQPPVMVASPEEVEVFRQHAAGLAFGPPRWYPVYTPAEVPNAQEA